MTRPLVYNAFTMNTASHINHGLWRYPYTRQRDFDQLEVWTDLAKLLERGKFDAMFLADVVGLYGDYRGGWETYVKEGLQIPSNDPVPSSIAALPSSIAALRRRLSQKQEAMSALTHRSTVSRTGLMLQGTVRVQATATGAAS